MDKVDTQQFSLWLQEWAQGDEAALGQLLQNVERELQAIARRQKWGAGQSLNTSDIVQEAYLALVAQGTLNFGNRAHFLAFAATVMRNIVLQYVRSKGYVKNGANALRLSLTDAANLPAEEKALEIVLLHEALEKLAQFAPRQARMVEMRYFAGCTVPEVAEALGLAERTVANEWTAARAWLRCAMKAT